MFEKCTICGGKTFRRVVGTPTWAIWSCRDCTTAFTFPVPASDLQYDDHTFFKISDEKETRWRQGATEIIGLVTGAGCRGTLLDVGFGSGFLIEEALLAGFDAQGIEASHSAVEAARQRGLHVQEGYLKQGSFSDDAFDVVTMNHVLEHSADAESMLRIAHGLVKPGGYLVLGQTNYLGTIPRLLGTRWYGWVPSEHYTHFSIAGLTLLLKRVGFEVSFVWPCALFWDWISFSRTPFVNWPGVILNNLAVLITKAKIGFPFIADGFFVLARKSES